MTNFGEFFKSQCRRKYVRMHDAIQNAIGGHLKSEGFEVIYESRDVDEDSSYRYDIIAQKKKELWIIEVKDVIDIRNFGQIEAYCLQAKKENPDAKVWLGTDCLNYWCLLTGEISEMVKRLMNDKNLGIILINEKLVWILPSHTDLLDIEEKGHLCEDCYYCNGLKINGATRKFLVAIEEGYKKIPKIDDSDYEIIYDFSVEDFKNIKTEFIEIKKKMGSSNFEKNTGIKIKG